MFFKNVSLLLKFWATSFCWRTLSTFKLLSFFSLPDLGSAVCNVSYLKSSSDSRLAEDCIGVHMCTGALRTEQNCKKNYLH